jgi:hypothetical protein
MNSGAGGVMLTLKTILTGQQPQHRAHEPDLAIAASANENVGVMRK